MNPSAAHYHVRGLFWYSVNELHKALKDFNSAIKLKPKEESFYLMRAITHSELGQKDAAEQDYNQAVRYGKSPENYNLRGHFFLETNRPKKALLDYKKAFRLKPKYAPYANNIGLAYEKLNNSEKALFFYKKSIRLDPKYAKAYRNLGGLYADLELYSRALSSYRKALTLEPQVFQAANRMLQIYLKRRQIESAKKFLSTLLRRKYSPESQYNFNMGLIYSCHSQNKDYAKAIGYYRKEVRLNPSNASAWLNLGFCHSAIKQYSRAVPYYLKCLKYNPRHVGALLNVANIYAFEKKYAQALAFYERALVLEPENRQIQNALRDIKGKIDSSVKVNY